jgi:uncharacterized membrane protein
MENSQGITTEYNNDFTTTRVDVDGASGPLGDILGSLFDSASTVSFFSLEGILSLLNTIWFIYAMLAYLACIFMLMLYVYASTGQKKLNELDAEAREHAERMYEEYFKGGVANNRLEDMLTHIGSDSPNDWKLAIIEADIILDELLKEAGYAGVSLGERLRSLTTNQLQSLDDAWQAHKVRNQIAHGGSDFVLTHKLAQDTIKQYRRVFYELGVR